MCRKPQQLYKDKDKVNDWIVQFQKDGSEEIQTQLVKHYQPLVRSLAKKFSRGYESEDLSQAGMVGLIAAMHRFDAEMGKNFESYAIPTVVGEIKRFLRDKTWSVHVPRRVKELGPQIKKAVDYLTSENHRSPQVVEIADYLGVTEEEVLETMEMGMSYKALSVDRSLEADQEGGEVTLLDLVGKKEEGYEQTDQQILLEKAFAVLTEREKQILQFTYYDNLSQKEAGEKLGISQMHVSRLQRRALDKLRDSIKVEPSECL
ncbi:RNA polymerase sigma factor SigB [Bacillus sp. FJAT-45350]|uniref:RNA polymerase sigma factor SigB n=1 Tax=Bacillus sp. FJAT-45350 TaxID=2011014 RepID=UPI000BB8CE06|nr:RNA polymerase sigma factor SigB [Bacillus sp. FJAT-45350]